jgi:hypothetical protein
MEVHDYDLEFTYVCRGFWGFLHAIFLDWTKGSISFILTAFLRGIAQNNSGMEPNQDK